MDKDALLEFYRHVMNHIHNGGNIFNNKDRYAAYKMFAAMASTLRQT